MKIGTLTFHRACNFGAALQAYALVSFLRNKGFNAEVVDYRSNAIEGAYRLYKGKGVRSFFSFLRHGISRWCLKKHFASFRKKMAISDQSYFKISDIENKYDLLIIGSDQVWSKRINHGFDPIYWGDFSPKQKVFSYAASMGTDHSFSDAERNKIRQYLNKFEAISVREDSLNEELSMITGRNIITVADPTLLLHKEDYEQIADCPQFVNEPYVLYYQMQYDPLSKHRVEEVAIALQCKIIVIGHTREYYNVNCIQFSYSDITVEKFVGLFLNARFVFSSSFHGIALSVAMRKDFYYLDVCASDRVHNLLKHIEAMDRSISPNAEVKYSKTDYQVIEPHIKEFIDKSKYFLLSVIEKQSCNISACP